MKIELDDKNILYVLDSIHGKYISTKLYFKENTNEIDKIGMTTPEELKDLYNNLLEQVHAQGEYKFLEKIK
ncbi:hypothetical protein IO99_01845 [Clostridium sulfidigenes]|uniref:Uncharacterized protein n=1 Tax=Clostridium sulfidigenes TaxID=318464 RepID=A0A084JIZ0_9CLOT|nr:hypothetical protein [Clostridium sulfidigenes]KEZ88924.1 hypothetical protein IO99_01845 [Clostridium sulfidigenes]